MMPQVVEVLMAKITETNTEGTVAGFSVQHHQKYKNRAITSSGHQFPKSQQF
jgi:hypothetical protein